MILSFKQFLLESILGDIEAKWIKNGASKVETKQYLSSFKDLKSKKRIDLDISEYTKDFNKFKKEVDKSNDKTKERAEERAKDIVYEDNDVLIVKPNTKKAIQKYGAGTKWCVTEREGTHHKNYTADTTFYFILSKKLNKSNSNYKIAVEVKNNKLNFWNAIDKKNTTDTIKFIDDLNLDKKLFKYNAPEWKKLIKYKENEDGSIDVLENLESDRVIKLVAQVPSIKINKSKSIDFYNLHLKKLNDLCPIEVFGDFDISSNKLTSLDGVPKKVTGDFNCSNNSKKFTEKEVRAVCNVGGKIIV